MEVFGRKRENGKREERRPASREAVSLEERREGRQAEPAAGDTAKSRDCVESRTCLNHLERQFSMGNQGVAVKLYIENFKYMNDLFGMEYCDELLATIMRYLEESTGGRVFRHVGVEFIIIMENHAMGAAVKLAERLIERFGQNWTVEGTDCLCSVQLGLCSYPGYASNAGEMLKYLDMAVARAAQTGSNQYVVYDQELHVQYLRRQTIARYLSTAIAKDEVELCYRPAYSIKEQRFTRARLYMRIFVKELGMISRAEYLSIAEDSGQIRTVEYYAFDKAASMIARLSEQGKDFESIAVPVSPMLLLQGGFLEEIARVIRQYDIPAKRLALEIDEYAAGEAYVDISPILQRLSHLGVELVLDQFGSGSTGLSRIFELPVDTVKFGRLSAWHLENNPRLAPVIEGLIRIAGRMDKRVIASGVETQNQRDLLEKFGCDMQEGFYYTPLMSEKELPSVLEHV